MHPTYYRAEAIANKLYPLIKDEPWWSSLSIIQKFGTAYDSNIFWVEVECFNFYPEAFDLVNDFLEKHLNTTELGLVFIREE
jgi:hypothetical protein